MSSTATRSGRTLDPEPGSVAVPLAPPPKLRRRPALVAIALAAILAGALLAAWAWTATTNTREVLVARRTITRGSVINAGDLARVRLSADPALSAVPASEFDQIAGKRAALDIAGGAMLTPQSFTSNAMPGNGESIVGVSLTPAQVPALTLQAGDHVRIVVTPGQGNDVPAGSPVFSAAEVVDAHADGQSGNTIVDLLVAHQDAALVAEQVSTGKVALVLDSQAN